MVKTVQTLKSTLVTVEPYEQNLKCVSVKLSEVLEKNKRLDASHFDLEDKRAREKISNCKYPQLPLFSDKDSAFASRSFYPGRFKRFYVANEDGIPFLSSSAILELFPKVNCKFLSRSQHKNLEDLMVQNGWILISRSGSVGNVAFASSQFNGCCVSEHVIRLIPTKYEDSGYIYSFLKTKYGKAMFNSASFGSVIIEIEPKDFAKIPVPNPPDDLKRRISNLITTAFSLRDEARILMEQARDLLFKTLNLSPIEQLSPKYIKTDESLRVFSVKAGDWEHRFDSSFHLPLYDEILTQLKKAPAELTTLGDKRISEKIILPGRFKRVYVEKEFGLPFLSGSDILQFDPKCKYLSISHHEKRIAEQLTLHENMILVTCSGTIGNVVFAPRHFEGWSSSQHVMRIVPTKEVNAGYIYTFLASSYGVELIKKFTHGSVVNEIDDEQLASVEFPLPSRPVQDKIGNLALEANVKLTNAYSLEQRAIKTVELIIENKL